MKRLLITLAAAFAALLSASADPIDELLPVRGLAIEAPSSRGLNDFLKFIEGDLVPAHFNLLILRVVVKKPGFSAPASCYFCFR